MGKTIRLTEEQIRRFFGEGFGRKLIGEGVEDMTDGENIAGRAPHQGFLNKSRVEFVGGQNKPKQDSEEDEKEIAASNFKNMAMGTMRSFGKTKFDYGTMQSDKGGGKPGSGINEVLDIIFKDRGGEPINILDLLEILHQRIPDKKDWEKYNEEEKKILNILDAMSIDYLLSGFVGLDAPDYVYHRLRNLTIEEVARIKTKFGKDFKGWGKICDGCGGKVWSTTVPTAAHDEGYTTFDFAATDTSNAGQFIKEEVGFGDKKIPFGDIMQIHHINGDPGNNSAWNLACLCPNCHACVDSTGRGRETVFSVDSIMGNGNIKEGSLNSRLRPDEVERIEKTIVDRINHGYFSDKTVENMILNNGQKMPHTEVSGTYMDKWVTDILNAKLPDSFVFPGYSKRLINVTDFRNSLSSLLKNAISFARDYRNKDKFDNLLVKNNINEDTNNPEKNTSGDIVLKIDRRPDGRSKNRTVEKVSVKLNYKLTFDAEKGGVLLLISWPQKTYDSKKIIPPKQIVINELGAVDGNDWQKTNIVTDIIAACISLVNEMIPKTTVPMSKVGDYIRNDKELFYDDDHCYILNGNYPKNAIHLLLGAALSEISGKTSGIRTGNEDISSRGAYIFRRGFCVKILDFLKGEGSGILQAKDPGKELWKYLEDNGYVVYVDKPENINDENF